ISLPSSRESEVNSITEYLRLAGAEVTGQIRLTSTLLSPAKKQFVEGIAIQSNPDAAGAGGTYEMVGSTLAKAYVDPTSQTVGQVGTTIRSAFLEGKLVENVKEPTRKAQLVVIVSGVPRADEDGQGGIVSLIASELDSAGKGVVVAGPIASGERGVVSDVRASDAASRVSTVDVTDLATGRVTTVLALLRESQGKGGSWGTTRSADGPVPH
ncbi:MAG: copper transporter, partial [Actinomycetales bacterium]|nr:copper transporter [Actinomycetales bacterium]